MRHIFIVTLLIFSIVFSACAQIQDATQVKEVPLNENTTTQPTKIAQVLEGAQAHSDTVIVKENATIQADIKSSERELAIAGMKRTLEVMKSADAQKIREYEANATPNLKDKADILNLSDKDVLDAAKVTVQLTTWTEDELRAPNTIYTQKDDQMAVALPNGDTYYAYKVDGVWY